MVSDLGRTAHQKSIPLQPSPGGRLSEIERQIFSDESVKSSACAQHKSQMYRFPQQKQKKTLRRNWEKNNKTNEIETRHQFHFATLKQKRTMAEEEKSLQAI